MKDVTIIGLGIMGTALARTLLRNGYRVTVWNRTADKSEVLKNEGAVVAGSCREAISANSTIVICIKTHADTRVMLEQAQSLENKNIIELSTGSAPEAEALYRWLEEQKARCLIGMICTFPSAIGENDSTIVTVGSPVRAAPGFYVRNDLRGAAMQQGRCIDGNLCRAVAVDDKGRQRLLRCICRVGSR